MNIPLMRPYIDDNIKEAVNKVLDSGYLTEGPVTKEFESEFSKYIGCEHAIAVTSCTTGLEVALRALNIGEGDEVIVPDYTYPATAAVVNIVGAKAVIVDVSKDSMLIDYHQVEEAITEKTKAVIPVSGFGNPLDYSKLNAIKEKYGIFIIEDAACSIGAEYEGKKVGTQADISVFSLHPRKFITTGEGGMITTDNTEWAEWMSSYKHFGMDMSGASKEGVQFSIIGTNYKLSNILSAVGLGQMRIIDTLLDRRRELAHNYVNLLRSFESIKIPQSITNGKHSYQSFCILIKDRDRVMQEMRSKGIEVQIGTYSLHLQEAFRESSSIRHFGDFNGSKCVFEDCLTLPLYHELSSSDQEIVVDTLVACMENR